MDTNPKNKKDSATDRQNEIDDLIAAEGVLPSDDDDSIEFDDNIDFDAIQAQLMEHMTVDTTEVEDNYSFNEKNEVELATHIEEIQNEEPSNEIVPTEQLQNSQSSVDSELPVVMSQPEITFEELPQRTPGDKKYVIYVDQKNIPFIDSLTTAQRKKLVNDILEEQDRRVAQKKLMAKRSLFIQNLIIATICMVIFFPIMFWIVNKAMEASIANYRQSKKNFEVLYKEQGKIKYKKQTYEY